MKVNRTIAAAAIAGALVISAAAARPAGQAAPTPDQIVAALKQNLAESQKRLRQYEWIETTVISLKGEEKSRKQQRVFYGADGKLTKLPLGAPPPQAAPAEGGRRGGRAKERIVENKKNDMQEYMEKAAALIHQYVPPSPERIQQAKDAGNVKLQPQPDGKARVELRNFVQPSDVLAIDVDGKAATLAALSVATYLEKKEDAVTLAVGFATLADGTNYAARTALEATAKNISVVVENSGHRPLAR
jgi:23S rRNA pseudoU1915 N3-methylase RlmH